MDEMTIPPTEEAQASKIMDQQNTLNTVSSALEAKIGRPLNDGEFRVLAVWVEAQPHLDSLRENPLITLGITPQDTPPQTQLKLVEGVEPALIQYLKTAAATQDSAQNAAVPQLITMTQGVFNDVKRVLAGGNSLPTMFALPPYLAPKWIPLRPPNGVK